MSLEKALSGIKQSKTATEAQAPPRTKAKKPLRVSGKSSNPEFEKVGVYVRRQTRRKAERKWQDHCNGDLSDLIENLLSKYVGD